jgi:hypothetical protein
MSTTALSKMRPTQELHTMSDSDKTVKDRQRQRLQADVDAWLAEESKKNKIQHIPAGVSVYSYETGKGKYNNKPLNQQKGETA